MMKKISLEETSNYIEGQGILNILTTLYPDLPWKNKIDGADLDLDYYLNHSGNKLVSRLVEKLLGTDNTLSTDSLIKLANIIYRKYGDSWKRVFSAFELQYNPIFNKNYDETFSDVEETTGDNTSTLTHNTTRLNTGTQSTQGSDTGTQSTQGTNTGTQSTQGTNTGTQSTSGSNTGTQTNVEDTTDDLTYSYTNYQEETDFGKKVTEEKSFPDNRTTTKVKSGNTELAHDFGTGEDAYTEKDELDFGTGNDKRKDETVKNGDVVHETNYNGSDNYKRTETIDYSITSGQDKVQKSTKVSKTGEFKVEHQSGDGTDPFLRNQDSWGSTTTNNRIYAFNGGAQNASDSTTYQGGSNGAGASGDAPSGEGGNGVGTHQRIAESGKYTDKTVYGVTVGNTHYPLEETTTQNGGETHTVKETGKKTEKESFTDYKETTSKEGKETHTITKSGTLTDTETYNDVTETVTEEGKEKVETTDSGDETLKITGTKKEARDRDSTVTRTDALAHSETRTDNLSNSETRTDNLAHNETRTDNLAHNETRTDNLSESHTGTETTVDDINGTRSLEHTYHGEGNIGVTTTQELLTSEVELRKMYSSLFDTIVYPDIDKVMVLGIFKDEHL